jgi:hypothetical protein
MSIYYSKSTGGFYTTDIHTAAQIPSDAVSITQTQWQDLLAAQAAGDTIQADSNGNPIAVAPPAPTLVQVQTAALSQIDTAAEELRAQFITANSGQVATYILKYNQAIAFQTANYTGTTPSLVQSEVAATGATPQAAAEAIIAQYNAWEALAASIETVRRTAKVAVNAAASTDAVTTAVTSATTGFAAIATAAAQSGESTGT